jgi:hypothetical protein
MTLAPLQRDTRLLAGRYTAACLWCAGSMRERAAGSAHCWRARRGGADARPVLGIVDM